MRLRHRSGRTIFLTCGVDLRTGGDLTDLVASLDGYAGVRDLLGAATLAVSLRLTPAAATALALDGRARARLRTELAARGLEVVTVDGVSLAEPGGSPGRDDRYHPDWTSPRRLTYTLDLARVLVDLLPDDAVRGSVSTVGVAWRAPWGDTRDRDLARMFGRLSGGLTEIAWHTGRAVRVGFQPEPGCLLDSTARAVEVLGRVDTDRLGVTLDLASLACAWEQPAESLDRLATAGIPVVRVQATTALHAEHPPLAAAALRGYVEPQQRHQTSTPTGDHTDDLDEALAAMPAGPWRIRYPLPLHVSAPPGLAATTDVWRSALRELVTGTLPGCDHLCVDTGTWDVLPPGERPRHLVDAVAAEFAYALRELTALGLHQAAYAG